MRPVEPTAFSQREVLSNSSTATWNPSSPRRWPAQGAVEIDLCRSEDSVPELVLQPPDAKAVGRRPSSVRGTRKHPDRGCPSGALGAGGHGEKVGIGHRAEPLLAASSAKRPARSVGHGTRHVGSDVRSPLDLGEELRSPQAAVVVDLEEAKR